MSGNVTLDGQPVETGTIMFAPIEGDGTVVSAEIKSGAYAVEQVPLGKVTVLIRATKDTGKTITEYDTTRPEIISIVPAKYQDGIVQEIAAGTTNLDFALDSK